MLDQSKHSNNILILNFTTKCVIVLDEPNPEEPKGGTIVLPDIPPSKPLFICGKHPYVTAKSAKHQLYVF